MLFVVSFASSISRLLSSGVSTGEPWPLHDISAFQDPALYSQAVFCNPQPGDRIVDATVYWRAGDGRDVPTIFIAHSPSRGIVVSCQGTNKTDKYSVMNDLQIKLDNADDRFNKCLDPDSDIHHGFQETWAHTADEVLTQVLGLLEIFPDSPVLLTGHSLGAAISTINYVYLRCSLPQAKVSAIVFGCPRVGDVNFANSVDKLAASKGNSYTHIVNAKDMVPHLPPRALSRNLPGYWRPSGEIWIKESHGMQAVVCPGQENSHCSDQYHLKDTHWSDHSGYYFNVNIHGNRRNDGCDAVQKKHAKYRPILPHHSKPA
ncbi:hypothetical protein CBS101457_005465 [Exobasidium rhododendri]|nr:hypothetical protein CBS101457_005465 [Exobasidium rhododendri]